MPYLQGYLLTDLCLYLEQTLIAFFYPSVCIQQLKDWSILLAQMWDQTFMQSTNAISWAVELTSFVPFPIKWGGQIWGWGRGGILSIAAGFSICMTISSMAVSSISIGCMTISNMAIGMSVCIFLLGCLNGLLCVGWRVCLCKYSEGVQNWAISCASAASQQKPYFSIVAWHWCCLHILSGKYILPENQITCQVNAKLAGLVAGKQSSDAFVQTVDNLRPMVHPVTYALNCFSQLIPEHPWQEGLRAGSLQFDAAFKTPQMLSLSRSKWKAQRAYHKLPARASSISCSVGGSVLDLRREYIDITKPGVQNPHWDPWAFESLSWTGWSPSLGLPIPAKARKPSSSNKLYPFASFEALLDQACFLNFDATRMEFKPHLKQLNWDLLPWYMKHAWSVPMAANANEVG